ncbi:hypothetical protein F5144DRAFT_562447 [Chaetomium tenue]|uniref:Uncharacterized protein n=1 Tax=Chaetomium tenue TaxID=1854479 RepID=A0ACB7PL12_9PEZI|nr:hypothetical protein F5144DRAFT_562447 [Chaetomium globosum]
MPSAAPSMGLNGRSKSIAMTPASMSQPKAMCMTSKEWVIPPRPKPGRKPATDTPPTKRKAQNRAAQRAFRERRAARVGELEEQMEEERIIHEQTVRELQDQISHLETETQTLRSRCQWLESMLEKSRQGRGSLAGNWDDQTGATGGNDISVSGQMQSQAGLSHGMRPLQPAPSRHVTAHPGSVAQPRPVAQSFSISQIVSPPGEGTPVGLTCGGCQSRGSCACEEEVLPTADIPMGCGRCTLGTRCECLEETLGISMTGNDLKRPRRPSAPPSTSPEDKRQRSDAGIVMETDFTAVFASQGSREPVPFMFPPPAQSQLQPMASIEPRDSCGFCKDGTYCVCADSMMSPASLPAPDSEITAHTQTRTPPPSDNDAAPIPMEVTATGAIKLPAPRSLQARQTAKPTARAGGCRPNGPGTCAQCVADPKSGLFCRSLAANFEKNNPGGSGGCCGNGGPGGCCKSGPSQPQPQPEATAPLPAMAPSRRPTTGAGPNDLGLSLSCADAYKTLASHRHFDEAADDIGSWLPKLKALPVPRPGPVGARRGGRDGRAPIEVEAASIMSVLKDFDVRFGRGE